LSGNNTVLYKKQNGIARIILNRPEQLNAFSVRMRDELFEILTAVRDDDEVKVGILSAVGDKAFCAGADLSEFLTAPPPVAARRVRWYRDLWGLFIRIPQPLIAMLHGYVLGSGIEMALCCDLRIAASQARFGLPEVALGIIPAAGGTQTLPRTIGCGKALELLLTNDWIDAPEALRLGLVNRVVPQQDLNNQVENLARTMVAMDTAAARSIKRAVVQGLEMPLEQGLALEKRLAGQLRRHGMEKG
jgi:enoyl-CoA hydratase/carnithine racemase